MREYYLLFFGLIIILFSCNKGSVNPNNIPREVIYDIVIDQPRTIAIIFRSSDSLEATTFTGTHWNYKFNPQHPDKFTVAHIALKSYISAPITGKAVIQINGIEKQSVNINMPDANVFFSVLYYIPPH